MFIKGLVPLSLSLICFGVALSWVLRVVYSSRRPASDDSMRLSLHLGATILSLTGLIAFTVSATHVLAFIGVPMVLLIVISCVLQMRRHENQALLWAVGAGANYGIPIPAIARALATEQSTEISHRAMRLAELVERGVPLAESFRQSGLSLPTEALLAVRMSSETGCLKQNFGVRQSRQRPAPELASYHYEKLSCLLVALCVIVVVQAFLWIKIAPVYGQTLREFEIEAPAITQAYVDIGSFFEDPAVILAAAILILGGVGVGAWINFRLTGVLIPRFWLIGDDVSQSDEVIMLNALASLTRQNIAIASALDLLSRTFPGNLVRSRIASVVRKVEMGTSWCESLVNAKLLSRTEAAVIKSAERVGNLPWALEEMADRRSRRCAYRVKIISGVLFPCGLFAVGVMVLFTALALLLPLFKMIEFLA